MFAGYYFCYKSISYTLSLSLLYLVEVYLAEHSEYVRSLVSALDTLPADDHRVTPVCAYCGEIVTVYQMEISLPALTTKTQTSGNEWYCLPIFQPSGEISLVAIHKAGRDGMMDVSTQVRERQL